MCSLIILNLPNRPKTVLKPTLQIDSRLQGQATGWGSQGSAWQNRDPRTPHPAGRGGRHSREGARGTPGSSFQSCSLPYWPPRGLQAFPTEGQPVPIFSSADQMVSVATTPLCHRDIKAARHRGNPTSR